MTSIGVIFAGQSKLVQRIYIPSLDDSEIAQQFVGPGEQLTTMALSVYQIGGADAVQVAIGAPTFSGRCAVVNPQNIVVDVIIADPALYADSRGTVIPHDAAKNGDIWDGTNFSRSYTEFNKTTAVIAAISNKVINNPVPANAISNKLMVTPPNALPGGIAPYNTAKG